MEFKTYKNLEEFFEANQNTVFRYWIYKKMFTPYEQENKFVDESIFTDPHAYFGRIQSIVSLQNGDYLLGILRTDNDDYVHYYKLSEIHIEFYEGDQY